MRHYNGKIERLTETFKGEIKPKKITGRISPVKVFEDLRLQFRNINALSGVANKRPTPTGKGIIRLNNRYVFFEAITKIFHSFFANVDTAPTSDIAVDNTITVNTETPLKPYEAKEAKVDRGVVLSSLARLAAYNRAPVVYIAQILTACVSKLISAVGAIADVKQKILYMILTARASKADSAILENRNIRFTVDSEAACELVTAKTVASETEIVTAKTAEPIAAETVGTNIFGLQKFSISAILSFAWEVIFKTHDNTLLVSHIVLNGKNCPDPVATGEIKAPTRESDVRYHYRDFIGWTRDKDGDADETALLNITASTELYPAFVKEIRYYTISFYDGETLVHTMSVAYGDTPSYTPTKSGYSFVGWTPEVVPVTGDAVYGAIWIADYLASGTCGDSATWTLTKAGDLIISGTGQMDDYAANTDQPWYGYASIIETVTVEHGITYTGTRAFQNLISLSSVKLPDSLIAIGQNLVYGCSALTEIHIPNSVKSVGAWLFYKCTNLTSITLPDDLTEIGVGTFQECTNLKTVTLPDSITNIGNQAFYKCTALESISLPSTVERLGSRAFSSSGLKTITIPYATSVIGAMAFYSCGKLSEMHLENKSGSWYKYSSETATSGSGISLTNLTPAGLADALSNRQAYYNYWLKRK